MVHALVELLVGPEHSQLIQQGPQVEWIGRLGGRRDPRDPRLAQLLGELGQVLDDQSSPFVEFQRFHAQGGPIPLLKVSPGPARQGREDHADVGGNHGREPHQVRGAVAVLQLVQRVQHQDHSPPGGGHVEPVGKLGTQRLGFVGDLLRDLEAAFQLTQDPPQHGGPVGTVRRSADEVHQYDCVGMGRAVLHRPVGQQGRLARARLAQHHQRRAVAGRVPVEGLKVLRAPDVHPTPAPRKGIVFGRVSVQGVRHFARRELLIDYHGQVFLNPLAECHRVRVVLSAREWFLANSLLERGQACDAFRVLFAKLVAMLGRDTIQVGRVAEVEHGSVGHGRVVQHPMHDLQLGDALLTVLGQPGLKLDQFRGDLLRNPAVSLAEQADEKRPTSLDFRQADGQDLAFSRLFLGNAPPQVHLGERHAALLAEPA